MKAPDPDRPTGDFVPRQLRNGEAFDLRSALMYRKNAVELWEGFERFDTAINAIGSIIASDRATLYPLPGALQWLVTSLKRWHRGRGKIPMDVAMGLEPGYQGGESDAARVARLNRDQLIGQHMARLTALGFSATAASHHIAVAIESTSHPPIAEGTIRREWPRMQREDGALPLHSSVARAMSADERKQYLKQFGSPTVPKQKPRAKPEIKPAK